MNFPLLNFSYFKITYKFIDNAEFNRYSTGNLVRGAFGETLRRMICTELLADCKPCKIKYECIYQKIFSPIPPTEATKLRKISDIPRGFVIHYPEDRTIYKKGDDFVIGLTLVGKIITFLPYIILTLNEIGKDGIGKSRSKMELTGIVQLNPFTRDEHNLFSGKDKTIRPKDIFFNINSIDIKINNIIKINFITPTRLIKEKRVLNFPDFSTLVKRLRDRYFALDLFYNEISNSDNTFDHKEFGVLSEQVTVMRTDTKFIIQNRHARTQKYNLQDTSGFVGTAVYKGNLEHFYKLIMLGQYFGSGKGTAFGYGRYVLE